VEELVLAFFEMTLEPLAALVGASRLAWFGGRLRAVHWVTAWIAFVITTTSLWHWRGALSSSAPVIFLAAGTTDALALLGLLIATGAVVHERLAAQRRRRSLDGPGRG
jgi:hypothetical protein